MLSSFAGLNMGMRALSAFSLGMQTVGNNISNIDTKGYSRQKVIYGTADPMDLPGIGQVGQGVEVESIMRIRDEFLDYQYRMNAASGGYWEKLDNIYAAIEKYFPEPLGEGISSQISAFFDAVQTLQQHPDDTATRAALLGSAETLGGMLGTLSNQLDTLSKSLNQQIVSGVDEANGILHEIATLNTQIFKAETLNQNANSLRDQRDLLLDQLSGLIDVTYKEDQAGVFWVTLNGRTLVQGDHVRELAAHPFEWNGQVYYDVQVTENEFDIVSNLNVADILATGPEGTYQLIVDRIANGEEWTVGGDDAYCLDTTKVTTPEFAEGKILTDKSDKDITRKIDIRTTDTAAGKAVQVTINIVWNTDHWDITAKDLDGNDLKVKVDDGTGTLVERDTYSTGDKNLTTDDLEKYIKNLVKNNAGLAGSGLTAKAVPNGTNSSLTIGAYTELDSDGDPTSTAKTKSMEITDYSGMLQTLTEEKTPRIGSGGGNVMMRVRPAEIDDALGLSGSFRIQVGSQGTRVTSNLFSENSITQMEAGQVLGPGKAGDVYTFRIGSGNEQTDITVLWNDSTGNWCISSDISSKTKNIEGKLDIVNLANYIQEVLTDNKSDLKVVYGSTTTNAQFYIESSSNHLISINDVKGDLAARLGMANENPVITIDVTTTDSLETIRNKINEKYQAELGLTDPEQWVHASIQQANDGSYYLTIAADVPGEAQRITLMGSEDGNMQVLRRLGLTKTIQTGNSWREVTAIATEAKDASFLLNGVRYLSSDNMFNTARRIPASGTSDYSGSKLATVEEGMWFNLKNTGSTTITVKHHVRNGALKALEDARDGVIPDMQGTLDELAYELATHFNAYQYSGYGIGNESNTTGVAFFDPLGTKGGAAHALNVNSEIIANQALIAAATGRKDANGIASFGKSKGDGDGSNATRLAQLGVDLVLNDGSSSFVNFYNGLLSKIGSDSSYASLMDKAQQNILDQINTERDSVSGVNLEEELVDIVMLNRCWGAMARYVTTIDQMLDTLINGFGVVGR